MCATYLCKFLTFVKIIHTFLAPKNEYFESFGEKMIDFKMTPLVGLKV